MSLFKKKRKTVGYFEKVSFDQYLDDFQKIFGDSVSPEEIFRLYTQIQLPTRSTVSSAGYDFRLPFGIDLDLFNNITIPTGICCNMDANYMLAIFPRSGLGFKNRVMLTNTVGIIDADYYFSDNEGHIMIKIVNDGLEKSLVTIRINDTDKVLTSTSKSEILKLDAGDAFAQGIFIPYGITDTDENDEKNIRNGGFGSTLNKK